MAQTIETSHPEVFDELFCTLQDAIESDVLVEGFIAHESDVFNVPMIAGSMAFIESKLNVINSVLILEDFDDEDPKTKANSLMGWDPR